MGTVMKMGYSINNHLNRLTTAPITKPPGIIDLQGLALALSRPMPAPVRDSNKLNYRFDDMPQLYAYYRGDSIPYKMLLYVGRDKLFPAHAETGRKVTREKAYSRRRSFWLLGSHYYTRRFYYKKRE